MVEEHSAPAFFPRASRLLALLFLFASATAICVNALHPYQMDFVSYWAASVLALGGDPAAAYNIATHRAVEASVVDFDSLMPFPYPPPFLFLLLPFGLLPYAGAAGLWIAATFTGYFAVARRLMPGSGWLVAAFPAVLVNGVIGQNGFLTAGLFIAGLLALPKRPFVAGLILGCLIIKPQLGVLLPVAFIAGGHWRAVAGAALSALGLLLLALILFGAEPYRAMIDLMPLYASIASDGLVGWHKMASVYASLRLAGIPADIAWAPHILVALAAAAAVWLVWRKECGLPAKAAMLAVGTALVSPYFYLYDTLILIVPFLWLAAEGTNRKLLALLWCLPLVSIAQTWGLNQTVNLLPVVTIALLILCCRRLFTVETYRRPVLEAQ